MHCSLQPDPQVPELSDDPGSTDKFVEYFKGCVEDPKQGLADKVQQQQQPLQRRLSQGPRPRPRRPWPLPRRSADQQAVHAKLVQRLEDKWGQLQQEAKKQLGKIPATPKPEGLPQGFYIDPVDGLMKCPHGWTVWSKIAKDNTVTRDGDNTVKRFYRCPIINSQTRDCFLAFAPGDPRLQSAEDLAACERSRAYWEGHQDELKKLRRDVKNGTLKVPQVKMSSADAITKQRSGATVMRQVGCWGEAYIFMALKLALPGFNEDCWVSANRQCWPPNLEDPDRWLKATVTFNEPPYDFEYIDELGALGTPGTVYKIDAKSSRGVAVRGDSSYQSIFVTANEWCEMRRLSGNPGKGTYIVIFVDRVDPAFQDRGAPRLAAVLVDPFRMAQLGTVDVEDTHAQLGAGRVKKLTRYPVLPKALTTNMDPIQPMEE